MKPDPERARRPSIEYRDRVCVQSEAQADVAEPRAESDETKEAFGGRARKTLPQKVELEMVQFQIVFYHTV